jgi:hypothetical protein
LLGERLLERFLDRRPSALNFPETVEQDEREKAWLLTAGLLGFGESAGDNRLPDLFGETVWKQKLASQAEGIFKDEVSCSERQPDQAKHDADADRPSGEYDLKKRIRRFRRRLASRMAGRRHQRSQQPDPAGDQSPRLMNGSQEHPIFLE